MAAYISLRASLSLAVLLSVLPAFSLLAFFSHTDLVSLIAIYMRLAHALSASNYRKYTVRLCADDKPTQSQQSFGSKIQKIQCTTVCC